MRAIKGGSDMPHFLHQTSFINRADLIQDDLAFFFYCPDSFALVIYLIELSPRARRNPVAIYI
jgi:hypothetical protein